MKHLKGFKGLVVAATAFLVGAIGFAGADYIRQLDTHQVNATHSVVVGGGQGNDTALVRRVLTGNASINFGATSATTCDDGGTTITVTGAADGDICVVNGPDSVVDDPHTQYTCYISAADTVTVRRCCEQTSACSDPAAATFTALVFGVE